MKRSIYTFLCFALAALLFTGLLSACSAKDIVTALDLAATADALRNATPTAAAPVPATARPEATKESQLETQPAPPAANEGDIQVYFTSSEGQSNESGALETALLADLDGARERIDVAMYNFSLKKVADALIAAKERGVQVRMVTDSDALDGSQFARLERGGIPVLGDRKESLMHNKFVVIDQRVVWTGSLNLTGSGAYQDNNNLARFVSTDMAANYTTEFEEMFTQDKFGTDRKTDNTPHPKLSVGGVQLDNYFAPEDKVSPKLVALVKGAKHKIDFLSYSFTSNPIGQAMVDRFNSGVEVRGVFEKDQYQTNQGSEYLRLKRAGVDARLDGNPGLMHEKVIIIDDAIVIFGSYNFTASADRSNDENVVVLNSPALARQFESEFARVFQQAHK